MMETEKFAVGGGEIRVLVDHQGNGKGPQAGKREISAANRRKKDKWVGASRENRRGQPRNQVSGDLKHV